MLTKTTAVTRESFREKIIVEAISQYITPEFLEEQIDNNKVREQRKRKLSTCIIFYHILYGNLFRNANREEILRLLYEGYQIRGWTLSKDIFASKCAISNALKRIGSDLFKTVYEKLDVAKKIKKEERYKGFQLKAFDGTVFNVEDCEENQKAFGKPGTGQGNTAWPQVRMVMRCDLKTRLPEEIAYGGYANSSECALIGELLNGTTSDDELILLDRGLSGFKNVDKIKEKNGQYLVRIRKNQIIKVVRYLKDGSYLGWLRDSQSKSKILVRVIDYRVTNTKRDEKQEVHRLITSLLDDKKYPARELIVLYHERWEIEISFDEIKTHLFMRGRNQPFFRSRRADGVIQELYGLLILYKVIRAMMIEAAQTQNLSPRDLSFMQCLHVIRRGVIRMQAAKVEQLPRMYAQLIEEMASSKLPSRRNRINPRVVKRRIAKFPSKKSKHYKLPPLKTVFKEEITMVRSLS